MITKKTHMKSVGEIMQTHMVTIIQQQQQSMKELDRKYITAVENYRQLPWVVRLLLNKLYKYKL